MTQRFVMRDAIHALRATSGESHDAEATRRRIVSTVVVRKRKRRQVIALVMFTFIGLPLGTTAYAAFFGTPAFVQNVIDRIVAPIAATPTPPTRSRAVRGGPGLVPPLRPEAVAPVPTTTAPAATSTTPSTSTSTIAATTTNANSSAVSSTTPSQRDRVATPIQRPTRRGAVITIADAPRTAPAVDPSDALYARAHELHFVTRDPAAALAAWDAYLAQAPSTTLLPEASYNRALCLVRLHRNADAIAALTPFANGHFGSYRKREAAALLQALTRER